MSDRSCNLHVDCNAADEAVREVRGTPEGASHCHDPNCKAPGCIGGGGIAMGEKPVDYLFRIDPPFLPVGLTSTGKIVGVATGGPQPPHVPEPLRCPPGSELAAFVAMLDRAKVAHQDYARPDGLFEVDVSTSWLDGGKPQGALVGFGSAEFRFDADGKLAQVTMEGD